MTPRAPRWRLWQLLDSALPTGGFVHSGGLESLAQRGLLAGDAALGALVRDALWQAGRGALPFVRAAHARPDALGEIDALCDAFLANHVARRASRAQGRALLGACARIFPRESGALHARVREAHGPQHLAPIAGATLGALGVDARDAQALVLHWTLRAVTSSAVRLGVVGPFAAQRIAADAAVVLDAVLDACDALELDDAAQTAPVLETAGMAHDALYSRMFQS